MPQILDKKIISGLISDAIARAAIYQKVDIYVLEKEIAHEMGVSKWTLRKWKNEERINKEIDDPLFFGLLLCLMEKQGGDIRWLAQLLRATDTVLYEPISEDLLKAYFLRAQVGGALVNYLRVSALTGRLMSEYRKSEGLRGWHEHARPAQTVLESLIPMEPESAEQIRMADEILLTGLTLYRFVPAFRTDFAHALRRGCSIRVILPQDNPCVFDMVALRSRSGANRDEQLQQYRMTLATLRGLKRHVPDEQLRLRTINYMPATGLTIYVRKSDLDASFCMARPFPFQASASRGPAILTWKGNNDGWFDYFCGEFERMWEASLEVDLEQVAK